VVNELAGVTEWYLGYTPKTNLPPDALYKWIEVVKIWEHDPSLGHIIILDKYNEFNNSEPFTIGTMW
jgi:hypothetical protein